MDIVIILVQESHSLVTVEIIEGLLQGKSVLPPELIDENHRPFNFVINAISHISCCLYLLQSYTFYLKRQAFFCIFVCVICKDCKSRLKDGKRNNAVIIAEKFGCIVFFVVLLWAKKQNQTT